MAHYVDTEKEDIKVISVNQKEAVELINCLVGLVSKTGNSAPIISIADRGNHLFYLAFQVE